MEKQSVNIAGIGLCTSMGGFKDACAAHRTGFNRFTAHDADTGQADDNAIQITVAPTATNLAGYQGVGKAVKMLHSAYLDLVANMQQALPEENIVLLMATPDPNDRMLDLNMPETMPREERLQAYIDAICLPLFDQIAPLNPNLQSAPMQCVFGDRVAFARIFQKALDMLNNGSFQHCLLMVTDSLLHSANIEEQLEQGLLKTDENPVGYIPGEGAALILLSASPINQHSVSVQVSLAKDDTLWADEVSEQAQTENEEESQSRLMNAQRQSWQGNKLAKLVKQVLTSSYEKQWFPQHISDVNGRENRAIELGCLQVQFKLAYPKAHFIETQVPALGFGEQGTMTGAIALATTIASIQRRYAKHREFLITLSEENGKRAAIALQV